MKMWLAILLPMIVAISAAQSLEEKIDAKIRELITSRRVPGAAFAWVKDGKIVFEKGFGFADLKSKKKVTPNTVFKLASLTKQFTAAIILQLMDEGKLKLDDPISLYVPKTPETWNRITIRQLLNHTSGIKNYTEMDRFGKLTNTPTDEAGFLQLVGGEPLDFEPGTRFHYSNSGYFLLGLIAEHVTGKPMATLTSDRIFKPLGMDHTRLMQSSEVVPGLATGYDALDSGPRETSPIDMSWPFTAGGMASTVDDVAKWDAALYSDKVLPQAIWKQAWAPGKLSDGTSIQYGFGWVIGKINQAEIVEHAGDINGFNADILRIPSKKLTLITLCNANPGIAERANFDIAGIIDPALKVEVPGPIKDVHPEMTAADRELMMNLLEQTLKPERFGDKLKSLLFPDGYKDLAMRLRQLGDVEDFRLIAESAGEGVKRRVYLVQFRQANLKFTLVKDRSGQIIGLTFSPV